MKSIKIHSCLMSLIIVFLLSGFAERTAARETDPAILELRQSIKQNPNDSNKHLKLANVYFVKYLERDQKHYLDSAIEEAQKAIKLKPDFARAHAQLSWFLIIKASENLDEDLITESKRKYQEALRLNPELAGTGELHPPHLVVAAKYLKMAENDKKYMDLALKEVKEAVRVQPNSAAAHHILGNIYFELKKNELAILELKEALRLNPINTESHKTLAKIYYGQGKTDLAISELKEAVKLNPDDPEAHFNLGFIYTSLYWDNEAIENGIKQYKEVIRLIPENAHAHRNLAHLYSIKGLYDLQIFEAKEALRLKKSAMNHAALGSAYLWKGKCGKALKEYQEALRLKPDFATVHCNFAYTYFLEGRYEAAIDELEKYFGLLDSPYGHNDTYRKLWQHLLLRQIGKDIDAQKLLEDYDRGYKGKGWELEVFRYHQGKISESELISRAGHKGDQCEAFFYIGYQYLLKGDKQKAREYFQKTLETNAFGHYEYIGARYRLEQLRTE